MAKKYTYEIELLEAVPEYMKIPHKGTVSSEKEWFGHSYGEAVGRIHPDGTMESLFKHDRKAGNCEWFEELLKKGILRSTHRHLIDMDTFVRKDYEEFYLMHKITGHSSGMPTVTGERMNGFWNVQYEYTYEILLVADDEYKRYITNTVRTEGRHLYCLFDEIQSLEDIFEEWAENGEKGFRLSADRQSIKIDFYDDFGQDIEAEFENVNEILECINSIRIIDLKSKILKEGD